MLLRREEPAEKPARRFVVSPQTLYRWRDEFLAAGEAALANGKRGVDPLGMPVMNGDQLFPALSRGAYQHQDALPVFLQSDVAVDAVRPCIDVLLALQGPFVPLGVLSLPVRFPTRDRGGAVGRRQSARAHPGTRRYIPL